MSEETYQKVYVPCGMCTLDTELEDPNDPTHVVGGVDLQFYTGYAMFTDDAPIKTVICHDCTTKILDLFPEEFKKKFLGGHPGSEKCGIGNGGVCNGCEYSWSYDEEEEQ